MRIADSGFLIAYFKQKDEFHERALELAGNYRDETLLCTTAVLQEVVDFIRRHDGQNAAVRAASDLLNSNLVLVEPPRGEQLLAAVEVMKKFPRLTFCDALTAAVAEDKNIRQILSFDSDFDAIKRLKRIH